MQVAGVALAAALGGCGDGYSYADNLEVETEINPDLDFTQYQRFEIINPIEELYDEPPKELAGVNLGILSGIESELEDAGLIRSELEHQLVATPYVTIEPTAEFSEGVFGYYWGYDYSWAEQREHERDVLVIDVVDIGDPLDADDDVLAFRGIARGLSGNSQDGLRELVGIALAQMFADFPND
jgi:hypothetical protein